MDIFGKLPFLHVPESETEGDLTPEELKKERIKFHRERVRNGPVKFTTLTSGQIRRAKRRELDRRMKKARRAQVRAYRRDLAEAARIRAMLQAAGVIPYVDSSRRAAPGDAANAIVWILRRFGKPDESGVLEVTREVVMDSLTRALQTWQQVTGQPKTQLSEDYELPVAVSA